MAKWQDAPVAEEVKREAWQEAPVDEAPQAAPSSIRVSPMEMAARLSAAGAQGLVRGAAALPLQAADIGQRAISGFTGMPIGGADIASVGAPGQAPTPINERGLPSSMFDRAMAAISPKKITPEEERASVVGEFAPAIYAGGVAGARALAVPLQNIGRSLMYSSLKPILSAHETGKAARAVETMLEKGYNVSKGGVEKLRSAIDDLNDKIQIQIAQSPATVDKLAVASRLRDVVNKFKMQVDPHADLASIRKAWLNFMDHPLVANMMNIPVQLAQQLKQGTYRQLAGKYGELKSAEIESQKALARGLKEEIAHKVPGIHNLNKEESRLIDALDVTERRVFMDLNKNPGSLGWLAASPKAFAGFVMDKSALFKSLLSRAIYKTATPVGASAGGLAGGVGYVPLSQLSTMETPPQ